MLKTLFRTLFLILLAGRASAQLPQWVQIPEDQSDVGNMSSMVFTSHDTGYLFSGSKLIRTTDSGVHFTTLKLPNNVSGRTASNMSWPTNNNGYIAFYDLSDQTLIVRTHDAGNHFDTVAVKPANLGFTHISFPTADIGYAVGGYHTSTGVGDTGAFLAKSIDSGKTWTIMYHPSSQSISDQVVFADPMRGVFFDVINGNSLVVDYTPNGGSSVITGHLLASDNGGLRQLFFMDDSTWIVNPGAPESLLRTTDSGRTWKTVVQNGAGGDPLTSSGNITAACFNGMKGFAFEDLASICYVTTDGGANWFGASTMNALQSKTLRNATAASFPSPTIAYVLGTDSASLTDIILLKIDLPAPPPPKGVRATSAHVQGDFTATADAQSIAFAFPAKPEGRSIEILDLLGRPCAEIHIGPNAEAAKMSRGDLRPGTYFARLGDASAKFTIY